MQVTEQFRKYGLDHILVDSYFVDEFSFVKGKKCGKGIYRLEDATSKNVVGYNVVLFRYLNNSFVGGTSFGIVHPPSSKWGSEGWSFYDYGRAKEFYDKLNVIVGKDEHILK